MKQQKIYCIGDSNTYGYDPRSYFGSRYPKDIRWTGLLEKEGFNVINLGINGLCIPEKTTYYICDRLLANACPGDIVCVMLGTNDVLQGTPNEVISAHMEGFLKHVKAQLPGVQIILISPPCLELGDWVQSQEQIDLSAQLGDIYSTLTGDQGVLFADAAVWNIELAFDGVHFSPAGHAAFAIGISTFLRESGGTT